MAEPLRRWCTELQRALLTPIRALASMAIVQGTHLRDVTLASGANQISHKLGRLPRGWVVTRQSAALGLYETDAQVALRGDQFLTLTSGAAGTADLWVF